MVLLEIGEQQWSAVALSAQTISLIWSLDLHLYGIMVNIFSKAAVTLFPYKIS